MNESHRNAGDHYEQDGNRAVYHANRWTIYLGEDDGVEVHFSTYPNIMPDKPLMVQFACDEPRHTTIISRELGFKNPSGHGCQHIAVAEAAHTRRQDIPFAALLQRLADTLDYSSSPTMADAAELSAAIEAIELNRTEVARLLNLMLEQTGRKPAEPDTRNSPVEP